MTGCTEGVAVCSEMAVAQWGVRAGVTELSSTQDRVFRLEIDGGPAAVMKLTRADRIDEGPLRAEAAALLHLQEKAPWLRVPLLRPGVDGNILQRRDGFTGRMMSWVDGTPLERAPHWRQSSLKALGQAAGQVSHALADFTHPGLRTDIEWDPRQSVPVLQRLLGDVTDGSTRALLTEALAALGGELASSESARLPEQAVHLDLTDRNVLGHFDADGHFMPVGAIDFGDLVWTWRISELAVTCHAAVGRGLTDPLAMVIPVVEGFVADRPITEAEADHLWTLIVARAATCVAIEAVEADHAPDNEHVREIADLDTAVLRAVLTVPAYLARSVIRVSCGATAWPFDLLDQLRCANVAGILSSPGPAIASPWQDVVALADVDADHEAPEAMRLGVAFVVPHSSSVFSPLDAEVIAVTDTTMTLRLRVLSPAVYLSLGGVSPRPAVGATVARGDLVALAVNDQIPDSGVCNLTVQIGVAPDMPPLGRVRDCAAWSALCPDPAVLVGCSAAPSDAPALDDRHRHVAAAQRLYYRNPPLMVRARGQWMYDATGRRYLDMVNNVAVVGHSHPRITAAAAEQLAVLNTNSRFLYRAISEYADRIAETLPPQLDRVFLVNSGSEALELALQLTRRFTERRDVVALEGAYHGWTTEMFELCTMPADRPNWRHELAPYVHIAQCPDWFRGPYGADREPYVTSLFDACQRAATNGGLAGFVHEPISGSRGGIVPPAGYLAEAYALVRTFGGLCVADEVQVGYGRTGKTFWAFEDQQVVPDVVASAKAAGNGHPIGFVACRTDIAEVFATDSTFFSTPAGSPVSCRIGTAVLDIIRDERLQENAHEVGAHLSQRLAELTARHPEIGAVYGRGLYQGIDLVVGDSSTTPLPASAIEAICERLLDLGCVVQPTGLLGNVLKIKPPLCLTHSDADRFVDAVDRVLTERSAFRALSTNTPHTNEELYRSNDV